ncbi:hypothetical protein V8E54_004397 [Elaphomyces granulatus]|jgi:hypothetical protein
MKPEHVHCHELLSRLKTPFVFHVSFENGTQLRPEEMNDLESAVGLRMLHQLPQEPFDLVQSRFLNVPVRSSMIFRLLAEELYEDFMEIVT